MTGNNAIRDLNDAGWALLPGAIALDRIADLRRDLQDAYAQQRPLQIRNGVAAGTDGTVHHLPLMGGSFIELLESQVAGDVLSSFFGGPYILNTFGGVLNLPDSLSYVGGVHRDLRSFSGDIRLMAQLLVMLDDFTEANGATYLMSGSHRRADKPPDEEFFKSAARAIGPAGSVVIFNSNLWHAAGANTTGAARRALTLAFTKPFMKQQLDYPRALGYDRASEFSEPLRQVLGYNARVPSSLDEWYQPPQKRLYQRNQG
jgi:Phytanoyl-CoA dioxygenase (PhyH)